MSMRKIDPRKFRRATRSTQRDINRTIVLNLVREHQPVSRAELARLMKVSRATVGTLVSALLEDGVIFEGALASTPRGRRPQMLHVRTGDRLAVAIDVRFDRTHMMLSDLSGGPIAAESFPTLEDPVRLTEILAERVSRLLHEHGAAGECEGIGLVVPGMVDRRTGRVLNSPALGWREVPLREMLAARTGLRVMIENAPIACALARMWLDPRRAEGGDNFTYVTVSTGVGVGTVIGGEVLRGHGDTAGEFGHLPLNIDGPRCVCGLRGCLEAYASNLATLGRYLGADTSTEDGRETLRRSGFTMADLVSRAGAGDATARAALEETGRYLGLGLAGIVAALSPARIYVDGEITLGWDMVAPIVHEAARSRALTEAAARTPIVPILEGGLTRLRGAVALLVAREFAAPKVA
jgi:N-acetylglucosamine repressor